MDFYVRWAEDGSATVLARVTARDGTGSYTGVRGEGNWLKQADVSTITCKVFDLDGTDPTTPTREPAVTVSSAILDTPVTDGEDWDEDDTGYNFQHDLLSTDFPTGERRYRVEYKFTLTGSGAVFHGSFQGTARPITGS